MDAAAQPYQQEQAQQPQADAPKRTFTVAVEGCCHGELDNIYATLQHIEATQGRKVDLLICCGDFQSVRNLDDLETMSVPVKYRAMMTFWKYYSGQAVAPVPTLFIGGNHEASAYLRELFYGGWAAPNIYFLGFSGCVRFGGHRIAGLSGTFVAPHYDWGHFERLPYDDRMVKSIYHVRKLHVHRLMQLHGSLSLFLSHDWPNRITQYGNKAWLFRKKPYFQAEAERGDLGSPPSQELLQTLQPDYWFAAHLHIKFPAVVPHTNNNAATAAAAAGGGGAQQQQEQQQAEQQQGQQQQQAAAPKVTRFLALDKCLPRRDFLQLIELDVRGPLHLEYDPQWLAILRSTAHLMTTNRHGPHLRDDWGGRPGPRPEDVAFVEAALAARGGPAIPANFAQTAAPYDPASGARRGAMPRHDARNPQTEALLAMLGLTYNLDRSGNDHTVAQQYSSQPGARPTGGGVHYQAQAALLSQQQRNPEEIDLDDDDDDSADGEDGGGEQQRQPAAAAAADSVGGGNDGAGGGAAMMHGGALADGAPDSDDEAAAAADADDAAAAGAGGSSAQQQRQQREQQRDPDDPMFGDVNTAAFPFYNS